MQEVIRAADITEKGRMTELQLKTLDHFVRKGTGEIKFLIDTGVYKTLLSEANWEKLRRDGFGRTTRIKR